MSDRNRALVAVGVLFAVLALAMAAAVLAIVSVSRNPAVLRRENVPYAVAIATAALNAKGLANDERGYLVSGKPEFLALLEQHVLNVRMSFAAAACAADRAAPA
jgi:CHASE3 domain sensor protein